MLYGRRKRLQEMAEREAAGESLWTAEFSERVRVRLVHLWKDATGDGYGVAAFYMHARDLLLRDEGRFYLHVANASEVEDLLNYLLRGPHEAVPSVLEAMHAALSDRNLAFQHQRQAWIAGFEELTNMILREERISFEMIDGQMVEVDSLAMHANVVAPALTLLGGAEGLDTVEKAYKDALDELSKGKAGDAITDAGTALQEMLTVLGCEGNALGPLLKSARTRGLLAGHDAQMIDGIEKIGHWVSADRSEKGDAHKSAEPSLDDAWFTVNVVGALVLRLSKGTGRQ